VSTTGDPASVQTSCSLHSGLCRLCAEHTAVQQDSSSLAYDITSRRRRGRGKRHRYHMQTATYILPA
jgi:hypothetical protein